MLEHPPIMTRWAIEPKQPCRCGEHECCWMGTGDIYCFSPKYLIHIHLGKPCGLHLDAAFVEYLTDGICRLRPLGISRHHLPGDQIPEHGREEKSCHRILRICGTCGTYQKRMPAGRDGIRIKHPIIAYMPCAHQEDAHS